MEGAEHRDQQWHPHRMRTLSLGKSLGALTLTDVVAAAIISRLGHLYCLYFRTIVSVGHCLPSRGNLLNPPQTPPLPPAPSPSPPFLGISPSPHVRSFPSVQPDLTSQGEDLPDLGYFSHISNPIRSPVQLEKTSGIACRLSP